ncbi:hypothetical protein [Ralstonia mojiangensis]|uniref:hypothetical protein n=1 Tax=Ralstonia mojiangensis TaxID=2953895 RepID=UPI002090EC14|nr:hypothetical protein [Ralstonia mojiangensis]MCO5411103.1 hypothetical protein [Ralstonia mojiangensis]
MTVQNKPDLPWRRRQAALEKKRASQKWAARLLKSRSLWFAFGGVLAFVLTHGVESIITLRKLPLEAAQLYRESQSWFYGDSNWTGTWSSREEGDVQDYHQSDAPIKLSLTTEQGAVVGEIFTQSVCELNPMLLPVLVEGEIHHGRLRAFAYAYVGGQKQRLYSFQATRANEEPVITLTPIDDPVGLLPASARIARRMGGDESSGAEEHSDLQCSENALQYLQRLRKEKTPDRVQHPIDHFVR